MRKGIKVTNGVRGTVEEGWVTTTSEDIRARFRGAPFRNLFRFREAKLQTYSLDLLNRPFAFALSLRLLARGSVVFEDSLGRREQISVRTLISLGRDYVRDLLMAPGLLRATGADVDRLSSDVVANRAKALDPDARPVYLRAELAFGVTSGGSVAHAAGVIRALGDVWNSKPVIVTTDPIATVPGDVETHVITPGRSFRDLPEVPSIAFNRVLSERVQQLIADRKPAFVYQRYSLNSYSGILIARHYRVPLILEYNGSETWIARNWGRRLANERLSERIELLNLRGADLVVVVSKPMLDELVVRGVDPTRILVNPNGVDPDRYSPSIDGSGVRSRLGMGDAVVFGFIGTFSAWHGADILAKAFVDLVRSDPALKDRIRLLMIGDGPRLEETRSIIEAADLGSVATFVGRTSQDEGPSYLAACDVLVSPHVPNTDGTPFFGSPTKLFEYMAMGKAIIASRLDQIGEVISDHRTGVLVPPADPVALAGAMRALADDPGRRSRLGASAREEAVANHTWRGHTRRIVDMLKSMYA